MPVKPRTVATDKDEDTASTPAARTAPLPVKSVARTASNGAVTKSGAPRQPKGPALTWGVPRDQALLAVIKAGAITRSAIAEALQDRPEFEGVPPSAFGPVKIGNRLAKLRKTAEEKGQDWIVTRVDMVTSQRKGGVDVEALEED